MLGKTMTEGKDTARGCIWFVGWFLSGGFIGGGFSAVVLLAVVLLAAGNGRRPLRRKRFALE